MTEVPEDEDPHELEDDELVFTEDDEADLAPIPMPENDELELQNTKGDWWREFGNGEDDSFLANEETRKWFKEYFPETQALIETHS